MATESKIQKNFRTITPFSLDTYQPIYSKIDFQLNFSHKVKSEDLAKNFSKIFPEEKISPGKYEIKIFKEGQRWPKRSAIFYISDFAVGIKDFADERFQILAENFDGSPINGVSEKIEIWANNELQKTLTDFDLWEIINTLSIIGSST